MKNDICKPGRTDVTLLCSPTRAICDIVSRILKLGINTIDSFDLHSQIPALRQHIDPIVRAGQSTAIISAGWDLGSDSIIRVLMQGMVTNGLRLFEY